MNYTLNYASSRAEVWHWYWKSWRTRLWRQHVLVAVFFSIGYAGIGTQANDAVIWLKDFMLSLPIVILLMAAVPQILFKNAMRTLQIGPEGWSTVIGKNKGSRNWTEVASIHEDSGAVIITSRNGNALIVPARAFQTTDTKERFIRDIRAWHGSARVRGH